MAAGLTLRPEDLEPFRQRLNALARDRIPPEELEPALRLDFELPLSELSLDLVTELRRLDPIGQGNPDVQVVVKGVQLACEPRWIGSESRHARFKVRSASGIADAVWWNCAGASMPADRFDLAVSPQINVYQGRTSVQLKVLDWRPAE
jgi:single-stranded-DNA-specific exonuclease